MSFHIRTATRRSFNVYLLIVLFLGVTLFALLPLYPPTTASVGPMQAGSSWTQVANAPPAPRGYAAMAYDSLRGRTVLYGGTSGVALGDTWEWDGTVWTQMATSGPSPRYGHALAYDSKRQRVVLFGGQTTSGFLADTWEWDGAVWKQVATTGPPARSSHAMVYDSVRGRVVLYGGYDGSGKGDTWEWNGAVWSPVPASASPGVRYSHAMAFDEVHQRSVLFGGANANGAYTNDTWEWDGTAWTQTATTGPSPRFGHGMAFDRTCGKVILFGGYDQNFKGDTWAWNGATWSQIDIFMLVPRYGHAMAYDSIRGTIVLYGGILHDFFMVGDTWEWRSPCNDEAAPLDANGEVVFPPNIDPSEPITYEDVNEDAGYVSDLYPSFDTTTDTWYKDFPCNPSIGGTIPPEASNPNLTEQLEAQGITGVTPQEIANSLSTWQDMISDTASHEADKLINAPPVAGPYTPPQTPHCTIDGCKYIFGGRDIVFIHGLDSDPLIAKIFTTDPGALTEWPQDKAEFYGTGYWKRQARSYWSAHIKRFLTDRGIRNRYLIVAYPSTQRLEIAVQAVLAQIADAMQSGEGVVDLSGHNDKSKFGTPSFVIVSHSTGGLVADAAMRSAVKYPNLGAAYIPQFCKGQVALQAAFSGSRYATAAVAASAYIQIAVPPWLCPLVNLTLSGINAAGANNSLLHCPINFSAVTSSILVDLVPLVSQLKWGSFVRDSPVRTITVVGGHPSYVAPLKNILQPGFDDGVLNINSQVANPNTTLLWPSGYGLTSPLDLVRVFDMGVAGRGNAQNPGLNSPLRAIGYYIDQVIDPKLNPIGVTLHPLLVAAAATPYTSPTGMLQPPGREFDPNLGFNPLQRYPQHYSFIQSAADHFKGSAGLDGWNGNDYRDSFGERNFEEVRVITDSAIYAPYGMFYPNDDQPLITQAPRLREEIRGRKVTFKVKIFGKKFSKTWWIWKRRYHLAEGWRDKVQLDYVQELVLRGTGYKCPPPTAANDCNHNGIADECDIASGASQDCNHNGIPDECESIQIPPPVISQGPVNAIVIAGQSVTFSVTATNPFPLSYQWRKDGVNLTDGQRISGATTSTLTINPAIQSDEGFYDVIVTGCKSVTSGRGRLIVNCVASPAGMVAWWPFDKTAGTTANDISGFNNAGIYGSGSSRPTQSPGKVSGALCFDGNDDYLAATSHTELNFLGDCTNDAADGFTIDAWIKPADNNGLAVILDKRIKPKAPVGYSLFLYNGRLGFQMADGSFENYVAPGYPSQQFVNMADGQWHFVAVTVSRCRGGRGNLFVDGNLVLTFFPKTGSLDNGADLQIGRHVPAFGSSHFKGCLDELEIFKRTLSDAEVRAIFDAGSLGKCRASPRGSVTGVVVDRNGRPVQGVEVQVPDRASVTTNAKGKFTLNELTVTDRLAVSFSAPGFVNTTRVLPVRPGTTRIGGNVIVIWPRAAAVIIKPGKGGKVSFDQGGGLTIPPDSLVDKKGTPITGKVRVSLTYLDVSDPNQIKTAPGDFTARMQDKTVRRLESFGIFEAFVVDSTGGRVELAPGKTAALELPIPRPKRGRTPRSVGLFSFGVATGQWIPAGTLVLSDDGLTYNGSISQTGTWNADGAYDTTCITVLVLDPPANPPHGPPAAGCYVEATGVTYSGVSSGYTDSNGLVCLVVKVGEKVSLQAFSPVDPTWQSQPVVITAPSIVSGATGCINGENCPLQEVDLDIIVGVGGRVPQVKSSGPRKRRP